MFVDKMTYWLHEFNINSKLNAVALKTLMIPPVLFLQKPPKLKAKDHIECLTRLSKWKDGDIETIINEVR